MTFPWNINSSPSLGERGFTVPCERPGQGLQETIIASQLETPQASSGRLVPNRRVRKRVVLMDKVVHFTLEIYKEGAAGNHRFM